MIDPSQLLKEIIRPVLKDLDLWSEAAECLVLGTACVESECGRWVRQRGGGPAVGIFQMEPDTYADHIIWLESRPELKNKIRAWQTTVPFNDLMGNLYHATAMCRIHYLRDPYPIPGYLRGQAEYWKRVYNTHLGKGTVEKYIEAWNRFVEPGTG